MSLETPFAAELSDEQISELFGITRAAAFDALDAGAGHLALRDEAADFLLVTTHALTILQAIGRLPTPLQTHATFMALGRLLVLLLHQEERHRRSMDGAPGADC